MKIKEMKDSELEKMVTKLMLSVGIPANLKGYRYIRRGIILTIKDASHVMKMMNLYSAIAEASGDSKMRVERAIRHAIEVAWEKGSMTAFEELFGYSAENGKKRPTNSEFIAVLADKVRLDIMDM